LPIHISRHCKAFFTPLSQTQPFFSKGKFKSQIHSLLSNWFQIFTSFSNRTSILYVLILFPSIWGFSDQTIQIFRFHFFRSFLLLPKFTVIILILISFNSLRSVYTRLDLHATFVFVSFTLIDLFVWRNCEWFLWDLHVFMKLWMIELWN
jgi:hypothetical protein